MLSKKKTNAIQKCKTYDSNYDELLKGLNKNIHGISDRIDRMRHLLVNYKPVNEDEQNKLTELRLAHKNLEDHYNTLMLLGLPEDEPGESL